MEAKKLVIIAYEDRVVHVRTAEPEIEIRNAFQRGGVVSIIKDNKIIYTKAGKI